MIILKPWEEKLLQCLAFIGKILIIANDALNRVIDRKVDRINKEIIYKKYG